MLLLRLPLVEQRAHVGRCLLPLHRARIAGGDRLDLLDQLGAGAHCVVHGLASGGGFRLGCRCQRLGECGHTRRKGSEVADGGSAVELRIHGAGGAAKVRGRRSTATLAHLEQSDLAREIRVLALVVGEGLLGRAVGELADDAPAVALADRHGAVLVDATPGLARGRGFGVRRG